MVKNLSAMWETQVQSLGRKDPLEKGMATPLVFLPGESHGQRILAGYSPWGCKETDTTKQLTFTYLVTLYPTTLLKLFISSNSFLMECFRVFYVSHMICKLWQLYFFLPHSHAFSCLMDLAWTSNTTLNKTPKSGHPCLVPDLFGSTTHVVCGILVPGPGILLRPSTVGAKS